VAAPFFHQCPHAAEVDARTPGARRPGGLSPKAGHSPFAHFYNRDEGIDFAMKQIADILATRAWERHAVAATH